MPANWTLPPIGIPEDQELDFKGKMEMFGGSPNHFEMGKDMAAMANAYGGRIIVGAFEQQNVLTLYDPKMTERMANDVCKDYTTAQARRVSPRIDVQAKTVQHATGFAAVICVEPSRGQAIGVRVATKEISATEPKAPTEVYAFPIRDGNHTNWITPENLSMLMIPELRRTLLVLKGIRGAGVVVDRSFRGHTEYGNTRLSILAIHEDKNTIVFSDGSTLPLDRLSAPYQTADSLWRISCSMP